MTEHLLHHAQVCSMIEQVGSARMAQNVWRKLISDAGPLPVLFDNQPGSLPCQSATASVEEDRLCVSAAFPLCGDQMSAA
ncbi:MAG: hypothetical protein ACJAZD_002827 [Ilumatobacter sp.]|jgi:hypothetical protein